MAMCRGLCGACGACGDVFGDACGRCGGCSGCAVTDSNRTCWLASLLLLLATYVAGLFMNGFGETETLKSVGLALFVVAFLVLGLVSVVQVAAHVDDNDLEDVAAVRLGLCGFAVVLLSIRAPTEPLSVAACVGVGLIAMFAAAALHSFGRENGAWMKPALMFLLTQVAVLAGGGVVGTVAGTCLLVVGYMCVAVQVASYLHSYDANESGSVRGAMVMLAVGVTITSSCVLAFNVGNNSTIAGVVVLVVGIIVTGASMIYVRDQRGHGASSTEEQRGLGGAGYGSGGRV